MAVPHSALLFRSSAWMTAMTEFHIGIIGPGSVGAQVLHQLRDVQERALNVDRVKLNVCAILSSKKALLVAAGIALDNWKFQFESDAVPSGENEFIEFMRGLKQKDSHAIVVDCTASETVARHYPLWLDMGMNIATPNKRAFSNDSTLYEQIQAACQARKVFCLYSATVCAGLPILSTLRTMLSAGDEIVRVEGVLSGILSFLFNEVSRPPVAYKCLPSGDHSSLGEPRKVSEVLRIAQKRSYLVRTTWHRRSRFFEFCLGAGPP